jgi:hypothetical protein
MKRSGLTIVFVLVCAIVLVGAYGLGVCIREYRFHKAAVAAPVAAELQKPAAGTTAKMPPGARVARTSDANNPGGRPTFRNGGMGGMRQRFQNMSEEERQQAISQMRERFGGGRRRQGMPQLSDEDRQKMRTEMEDLRSRWDSMSEEERQQAQEQFREKYGFAPRGFGSRGFGGRRSRGEPNSPQQ